MQLRIIAAILKNQTQLEISNKNGADFRKIKHNSKKIAAIPMPGIFQQARSGMKIYWERAGAYG